MVLARGGDERILNRITEGELCGTLFLPNEKPLGGKKGWLAFGSRVNGRLTVDSGAAEAILIHGKSLLPTGIKAVEGNFDRGDVVSIVTEDGREIAKGFSGYSSSELCLIMGHRSADICKILGDDAEAEAVHRDNMSVFSA